MAEQEREKSETSAEFERLKNLLGSEHYTKGKCAYGATNISEQGSFILVTVFVGSEEPRSHKEDGKIVEFKVWKQDTQAFVQEDKRAESGVMVSKRIDTLSPEFSIDDVMNSFEVSTSEEKK